MDDWHNQIKKNDNIILPYATAHTNALNRSSKILKVIQRIYMSISVNFYVLDKATPYRFTPLS